MTRKKSTKTRKNRKGGSRIDEQQLSMFLDELNREIWENPYVLDGNIKNLNRYIDELHAIKNKLYTMPKLTPEQIKEANKIKIPTTTREDIFRKILDVHEENIFTLRDDCEDAFAEIDNEIAKMLVPEPYNNELLKYVVESDIFHKRIDDIYKMLGIYDYRAEVLFPDI